MKKYLVVILLLCVSSFSFAQNSDYENAWKSLNKNDRPDAEKFLGHAMKDPSSYADA